MEFFRGLVESFNSSEREQSLQTFEEGLNTTWGVRELSALQEQDEVEPSAKVLLVRHGMGFHNAQGGAGTLSSRDAELNEAGRTQAAKLGEALRERGVKVGLVVSSPFRRALQTACGVMTQHALEELSAENKVLVTPLAAEHTWQRTTIGFQGDRGSPLSAITAEGPFDTTLVENYCIAKGIAQSKWWHHSSERGYETEESFALRSVALRQWLGEEIARRQLPADEVIVMFGHGGIFVKAFGLPKYGNCECRVFRVFSSGKYIRMANEQKLSYRGRGIPSFLRATEDEPFVEIHEEPDAQEWRVGGKLSLIISADPQHAVEVVLMRETFVGAEEVALIRNAAPVVSKDAKETVTFTLNAEMSAGDSRLFILLRSAVYAQLQARTKSH